jgi:hypothetical protein
METKRDRKISILLSVLLHLFLVILLVVPLLLEGEKKEEQKQQGTEEQRDFTEFLHEGKKTDDPQEIFDVDIVESVSDEAGEVCTLETSSYIGIGIVYSYITQEIIQVPAEYPAYKAGIRIGDIYTNSSDNGDIRNIEILRDGQSLKFQIKTKPICYM